MKVAIICEFSGVVRRAFASIGHEVCSYDFLPAEDGEVKSHKQGDYRDFDLVGVDLAICHPPCTYLLVSGARD